MKARKKPLDGCPYCLQLPIAKLRVLYSLLVFEVLAVPEPLEKHLKLLELPASA